MVIAIGCDHAGLALKKEIINWLKSEDYEVVDCGTFSEESVDYPDIAYEVAGQVLSRGCTGILICGTGIGISIAANKIDGIRAAVCENEFTARMARQHNDANILAVGARVVGTGLALEIVKTFLNTDFEAGRHARRIEKIHWLEKNAERGVN
ncbi:MAG: ribose 5-phosphate isomerase B [Syntrophomonadaceae bacterium]|nr:ribose 5-phosphate isomerase B [Syntrophomonadaceae bacterium]